MIRSCSLKPGQICEPAGVKQAISSQFFLVLSWYNKTGNDWSCGKQRVLFPLNLNVFNGSRGFACPRETLRGLGKQNSLFPLGPVIKCLLFCVILVPSATRLRKRNGGFGDENDSASKILLTHAYQTFTQSSSNFPRAPRI